MTKFKKFAAPIIAAAAVLAMTFTSFAATARSFGYSHGSSINSGGNSYSVSVKKSDFSQKINGKEKALSSSMNMYVGEAITIQGIKKASGAPADLKITSYSLKSNNTKIASVKNVDATTKKIVGLKPGTAKITYAYTFNVGSIKNLKDTGSFKIKVKKNSLVLTNLSAKSTKKYLSGNLVAVTLKNVSGGANYEWSLAKNSPAIFVFRSKNCPTAVIALTKKGTVKLTAKSNGAATAISIRSNASKVTFKTTVEKGKTQKLSLSDFKKAKWKVSNKKIASVSKGIVKGLKKGSTKIQVDGTREVIHASSIVIGSYQIPVEAKYTYETTHIYNVKVIDNSKISKFVKF